MERLKLNAETREAPGHGLFGMRNQGFVPGVLYGKTQKPWLFKINRRDLENAVLGKAGFNALFDFQIGGRDAGLVRIREYQAHPIKRVFTHIDFQTVDLNSKVEVDVRVEYLGESLGVKEGGVLDIHRRSLHLKCLVTQIPEKIQVDISALQIHDSIHANDIQLPEGVEFPHEQNFTIVAVVPPKKEEEPVVVAAPVEGAEVAGAAVAAEAGESTEKKEKKEKKE